MGMGCAASGVLHCFDVALLHCTGMPEWGVDLLCWGIHMAVFLQVMSRKCWSFTVVQGGTGYVGWVLYSTDEILCWQCPCADEHGHWGWGRASVPGTLWLALRSLQISSRCCESENLCGHIVEMTFEQGTFFFCCCCCLCYSLYRLSPAVIRSLVPLCMIMWIHSPEMCFLSALMVHGQHILAILFPGRNLY